MKLLRRGGAPNVALKPGNITQRRVWFLTSLHEK